MHEGPNEDTALLLNNGDLTKDVVCAKSDAAALPSLAGIDVNVRGRAWDHVSRISQTGPMWSFSGQLTV